MRPRQLLASSLLLASLCVAAPVSADLEFADGKTWGFEIGFGGGWVPATDYTRRLELFAYEREKQIHYRMSIAVEKIVLPYLSVLLQTNLLDSQRWRRSSGIGPDDEFRWTTWTLDAHLRVFIPTKDGKLRFYAQFGVGPTFTPSALTVRTDESDSQTVHSDLQVRYNVAGLLGFEALMGDHVGFFVQGGYFYAPTPKNRLGDVHQDGGLVLAGIGAHFGRKR